MSNLVTILYHNHIRNTYKAITQKHDKYTYTKPNTISDIMSFYDEIKCNILYKTPFFYILLNMPKRFSIFEQNYCLISVFKYTADN